MNSFGQIHLFVWLCVVTSIDPSTSPAPEYFLEEKVDSDQANGVASVAAAILQSGLDQFGIRSTLREDEPIPEAISDEEAAANLVIQSGVQDYAILSKSMKPAMVKRLTEDEESVMQKLELDVEDAELDIEALRVESLDIITALRDLDAVLPDSASSDSHKHDRIVKRLKREIHSILRRVKETSHRLSQAHGHFEKHEAELHHLHAEVFAAQIAANVLELMRHADGVDYNSGDVLLKISNAKGDVSLKALQKTLLESLSIEREEANALSQRLVDPAVIQMNFQLLVDVSLLCITAAAGGIVAGLLYIPPLVGQVIGGLIVGPSGFHLVHDITSVHTITQLGSVFILVMQGMHFPLDAASQSSSGLEIGAIVMFTVIVCLSSVAALTGTSRSAVESVMYGVAMCISSTSVIKELLNSRTHHQSFKKRLLEVGSIHDLMMGVLLALPIALVGGVQVFVRVFVTVVVFGLASIYFRAYVAPAALSCLVGWPGLSNSDTKMHIFLGVVAWCLVFALSTDILGLSMECGAFASGMYFAGTANVKDIREMVQPLKILFGSLYFASIGMVLNLRWTLQHSPYILGIALQVIVCKVACAVAVLLLLKFPWKPALLASVTLAQVGDFSLLYVSKAHRLGLIGRTLYLHMLVAVVIMMVAIPALLQQLYKRLAISPAEENSIEWAGSLVKSVSKVYDFTPVRSTKNSVARMWSKYVPFTAGSYASPIPSVPDNHDGQQQSRGDVEMHTL